MRKHTPLWRRFAKGRQDMKQPITIDRFEENGVFVCPICNERISSRRKTTTKYVELVGDHYEKCAKSISEDKLSSISRKYDL